jgi:ubiquinone biosynthesis protein COQ4
LFRSPPIRPLAAIAAGLRLFRDSQDTSQVARLQVALGGYSRADLFERFIHTQTGQAAIRERRSLATLLDDHDHLRSLPENSFGRHYLAHMQAQGLTVHGLLEATPAVTAYLAAQPEAVRIFLNYAGRQAHDVHHVLGGYGRDELGEACTLAMVYDHLKIRGYKAIYLGGVFAVRRQLRRLKIAPDGVLAAIREARRIGRDAAWFPGIDIAAALDRDIDALRLELNLRKPVIYGAVLARIRAHMPWDGRPLAQLPAPGRS